ncbi:regulator of ribonuclease activity A [Reichenbachiella faecimaris]|uniref:4-hydroxy-4-methyl-2-oxoglutarate aldolase n=1 Tax=Reichenbachiella faecimaris TaxID=692418 RepID=A0A1W2GP43_REIFA|nr:ribonuclease E activity regulator RraA [Reichenbachiella faecimaris]SMD38222.1 regulator of ribonuclease activity A [Reichenbachiella faecimaris]
MLKVATADLWDQHGADMHCVDPIFRSYGAKTSFQGEITTLKLYEDNSLVRKQLATPGKGKVLIVDGGGSFRCALVGDQLAELAIQNEWEGLIIYGCIRDSAVINTLPIGIKALNTSPVKSIKKDQGEIDISVKFGSTLFVPGYYVYADEDGVLVSPHSY